MLSERQTLSQIRSRPDYRLNTGAAGCFLNHHSGPELILTRIADLNRSKHLVSVPEGDLYTLLVVGFTSREVGGAVTKNAARDTAEDAGILTGARTMTELIAKNHAGRGTGDGTGKLCRRVLGFIRERDAGRLNRRIPQWLPSLRLVKGTRTRHPRGSARCR